MKHLFIASFLACTCSSFAATLSCEIVPVIADKGGYTMYGEKFILKSEIQKIDIVEVSRCTKVDQPMPMMMCSAESEIVGGYNTALIIGEGDEEDMSSSSFGTSRESEKELLSISNNFAILGNVKKRLANAGIEYPHYWNGGDSLAMDDMVEAGIKKNVLVPNEVVSYVVNNCKVL